MLSSDLILYKYPEIADWTGLMSHSKTDLCLLNKLRNLFVCTDTHLKSIWRKYEFVLSNTSDHDFVTDLSQSNCLKSILFIAYSSDWLKSGTKYHDPSYSNRKLSFLSFHYCIVNFVKTSIGDLESFSRGG